MRNILIVIALVFHLSLCTSWAINDQWHNVDIANEYKKYEILGLFYGWYDLPLSKQEPDEKGAFLISSSSPIRIELGRGSGMSGLDSIKIESSTDEIKVTLHRRKHEMKSETHYFYWEKAFFLLSDHEYQEILHKIDMLKLMELSKSYHSDVQDGIQWILLIKQENFKKTVYCNNYFPKSIIEFSHYLNELLLQNINKIEWNRIKGQREHEKELWDSIR